MKIQIENLKALIHGKELNDYQKALAINEWSKLQLYVFDLERLNMPTAIKDVCPVCGYPTFRKSFETFNRCEGCDWTG